MENIWSVRWNIRALSQMNQKKKDIISWKPERQHNVKFRVIMGPLHRLRLSKAPSLQMNYFTH